VSKRLQRILLWVLATVVLSAAIHWATVLCYPYLFMLSWYRHAVSLGGVNQFIRGVQPTAENRDIPRLASPDLTYSALAFDLSEGPLRVTAPLTGEYMSVALYAANTDNFFVTNDRHVHGGKVDFVLVGPSSAKPILEGIPVVRSPNKTGIMIIRFFVASQDDLKKINEVRRQFTCRHL
jgi:uncharacterized membrane protein